MRVPRPTPAQFATAALVLAALSVGRVVTQWLPDGPSSLRPFERTAAVGEELDLRFGTLRVTSVDGGKRLSTLTDVKESPGVWVAVRATMVPSIDDLTLGYAELRDGDGRVLTKGTRNVLQCQPANPGIEVDCIVAFEVATDAAPGSVLALTRNGNDQRADDMAVVDLGISAADARSWAARSAPVELDLPRGDEP